jgi:hypothetical protein
MTIYPAPAPDPALRYRLFPSQADRIPGNAAITYYRSFSPEWELFRQRLELRQKIPIALKIPLNQIPKELNPVLESHQLKELDRAARQEYCAWELLERIRHDGFNLLLPEMSTFRQFGQCLALRARLKLAQGEYDQCLYSLQSALSAGHDLANAPLALYSLVGSSAAEEALNQVRDFVQQPGAPNLYWALATVPRPFVDGAKVIEGEQLWLYAEAPTLRDIEKKSLSVQEYARLRRQMLNLLDGPGNMEWGTSGDVALTHLVMKEYPEAKRDLIAEGRHLKDVEAMPVLQVCMIHALKQFRRLQDDTFKWFYLPPDSVGTGLSQSMKRGEEARRKLEGSPFIWVLPASSRLHWRLMRTDRHIALLQTVEALRLYAAAHGALPSCLEAVVEVPVPRDPATAKAFAYKAQGKRATLSASQLPHEPWPLTFELTLARTAETKPSN